ncbi:MAG TPA: SCP2 sterol-binding domain-containing protein, partial [Candidatus Dormibacteraeota bacterium]
FHLFTAFIHLVRFFQGRLGEVAHLPALGLQLMPLTASHMHSMAALAHAAIGADAEARRHLALADPEDPMSVPFNVGWIWCLGLQAHACAWLGERARAATIHRLLLPYAHGNVAIGGPGMGPCSVALGITAATAGMHEEAERHFADAVEVSNANGWRVITAQVQAHHAAMLLARDRQADRERARLLATQAAALAGELGLGYVAHLAERVLRALDAGLEVERTSGATPIPMLTRRDRLRARVAAGGRATVARLTRGQSDEALTRLFGSRPAQRAVFTAMAAAFQPAMAAGFEGAIVYELTPAEGGAGPDTSEWWTVEVRSGGASAHHRRGDDPTVSLRVSVADLIRLVSGELDPLEAIADMRIIVDGDVLVATRLAEMFGAVEPAIGALGDSRRGGD